MYAAALRELNHVSAGMVHAVDLARSRTLRCRQQEGLIPRDEAVMIVRQMVQNARIRQPNDLPFRQRIGELERLRGDFESTPL